MDVSKIEQVIKVLKFIIDEADGGNPSSPATSTPSATRSGGSSKGRSSGSSKFDAGPNKEIGQWSKGISNASEISGLDPNLIGGMVWAESRGDPKTATKNGGDGNTDKGLMQISQERWEKEVCPNLSKEERQKIIEKTGQRPEDLDMSNPEHSIIGGSLEMKQKVDECGGDVKAALQYYVSGKKNGNPTYAHNVLQYMEELEHGKKLSEDPHGSP